MPPFTENEKELINKLREEAWLVKNCFTEYSFKTLALAAAGLGLITRFQADYPIVGLAGLLVIIVVLAVARIGTHKYATANRNYGYQLHLERASRLESMRIPENRERLGDIGWEEAMRAWRVVQATTFENLYKTGSMTANALKEQHRHMDYKWFEPPSLLADQSKSNWHPGDYLGNMLLVLHSIALLALIPIAFMCFQTRSGHPIYFFGSIAVMVFSLVIVVFRIHKTNARLAVLEKGLLSIHSCSIMWHAVVCAHNRSLIMAGIDNGAIKNYRHFTRNLSLLAMDLNKDIQNIHKWIDTDDATIIARASLVKKS